MDFFCCDIYSRCISVAQQWLTQALERKIQWVLKMVESDFSFNSAENMVKLLCQMDKHSKIFSKMTLGRQKCGYYVTYALCPFYLEKLIKRVQEAAAYTLGVDGGSVTQRPEVNISPKNQYFFTYPKNGPARESRYPPGTWTWVDSNISARSPKKAFFLHKVAIYLSARTPEKMLFLCAI